MIQQRAFFCHDKDGNTNFVEFRPSNAKVLATIQRADLYERPPEYVTRTFTFCDGVPKEYEYLFEEGGIPEEENFSWEFDLPFDEFIQLAEMETQMPEYQETEEDRRRSAALDWR